jgi:hypothetical protein
MADVPLHIAIRELVGRADRAAGTLALIVGAGVECKAPRLAWVLRILRIA